MRIASAWCRTAPTSSISGLHRQGNATTRAKFGLAPDDKVVGMIGRMDSVKGQDVLLKALVDLRARERVAIALLADLSLSGSMEWGDKVREYAKGAGVAGQVQFLGYTDSRDVLWASDVCVPPCCF